MPLQENQSYRRLHRAFFALCIVLAPLTLMLWFGLCPTGANDAAWPDQASSLAVFAAFRAMNPQLMQLFLFLSLIIPYLYPLSYVSLGLLAMKRAPWLATLGIICGFAAGVVWAVKRRRTRHLRSGQPDRCIAPIIIRCAQDPHLPQHADPSLRMT
jgi:hypothetical protein